MGHLPGGSCPVGFLSFRRRRAVSVIVTFVLLTTGLAAMQAPKAHAATLQPVPGHTKLVPTTVRANPPAVLDGEVSDIATVGNRVVLAGTFTSIRNANSTTAVAQKYIA